VDKLKKVLATCKRGARVCRTVIHCNTSAYGLVASNRMACSGRRAGLPNSRANASFDDLVGDSGRARSRLIVSPDLPGASAVKSLIAPKTA
jgi:hypothetical protein